MDKLISAVQQTLCIVGTELWAPQNNNKQFKTPQNDNNVMIRGISGWVDLNWASASYIVERLRSKNVMFLANFRDMLILTFLSS